jgi:hypothetical protein
MTALKISQPGTNSKKSNTFRLFVLMILHQYSDWTAEVRFPTGARHFLLLYNVQAGSEVHPTSYKMGTGGSFPGVKATDS